MASRIGYVFLFLFCIGVGIAARPLSKIAYAYAGPAFTTGDFEDVYRQANRRVVLFSLSTCRHCEQARTLLEHEHVDYRDYVVDLSADARRRFAALDGDSVPTLLIGDRRIVGFREQTILAALSAQSTDKRP